MRPGQGKKNQTDFRFWQEFCFASKKLDVQKVRISFGEDEAYIYIYMVCVLFISLSKSKIEAAPRFFVKNLICRDFSKALRRSGVFNTPSRR